MTCAIAELPGILTGRERQEAETDAFAAACWEAMSVYVAAADKALAEAQRAGHLQPGYVGKLIAEARAFLRQPLSLVDQG
jgi:hypothetical protein